MTTVEHEDDAGRVDDPGDEHDAVLHLLDTEPVPLSEAEPDDDYERRASGHLGLEDPHDADDVLSGVDVGDHDPDATS